MTRMTFAHGLAGFLLLLIVVPSMSLRCYQDNQRKFCDFEVKHCRRAEKIINTVTNETSIITACDGDKEAEPNHAICEAQGGDGCQVFPGVGTICCCSSDLCNGAASSAGQSGLLGISAIVSVLVALLIRN
uniref:Uncharacterized protein n=1 Tax=Plectus sambesii TaxID=2011161 RepID=A0A914XHB9_9BILA